MSAEHFLINNQRQNAFRVNEGLCFISGTAAEGTVVNEVQNGPQNISLL